jgi:L-ascorbate metabolism protein UlaG (beta-lactamase superfamily)
LGDSIPIVKKTGAKLVCSPEIAYYAEKKGLNYDQESYPMNIGGSWRTKDFSITMVNALHTSDIMGEEFEADGTILPGSGCCGYILDFSEGPTIYYSGDTGVFGDMAIIRDLYAPDVAVLSVGGKYNMGYREAAYAASLIIPKYLIPIHHGAFEDQPLNFEKFEAELTTRAPKVELIQIKPGESFEIVR